MAAKTVIRSGPHWRMAGMNYLEAINVATNALRQVIKEPRKS